MRARDLSQLRGLTLVDVHSDLLDRLRPGREEHASQLVGDLLILVVCEETAEFCERMALHELLHAVISKFEVLVGALQALSITQHG
eukprot:763655-Hanusia_phi.AAC.3